MTQCNDTTIPSLELGWYIQLNNKIPTGNTASHPVPLVAIAARSQLCLTSGSQASHSPPEISSSLLTSLVGVLSL